MNRLRLVSAVTLVSVALGGCTTHTDLKTNYQTGSTAAEAEQTSSSDSSPASSSSDYSSSSSFSSSLSTGSSSSIETGASSVTNGRSIVNGKGVRFAARSINGVETKLEAPGDVIFLKGNPTKWPADALVSLSETRDGATKRGELRPAGTQMKVWMRHGNSFEPGTAEDQEWADRLLQGFKLDDTPESEKKKAVAECDVTDPQFAQKLATLHSSKDVTDVMTEKVKAPSLTTKEQIALIDLVFDKIHYQKDKTAILLQLIQRKDLSKEASAHLLDNLDRIYDKADYKLLQRELFNRK